MLSGDAQDLLRVGQPGTVSNALAAPWLLLRFTRMGSARGSLAKARVVLVIPGQGRLQRWAWQQRRGKSSLLCLSKATKRADVNGPCFSLEWKNSSVGLVVTGSLEGTKPHLLDAQVVWTYFCCAMALAKVGAVEISDLLVVSSEHSTGQACLVASGKVESSWFCMELSSVSLSCLCGQREWHVEKNGQGETFWVVLS